MTAILEQTKKRKPNQRDLLLAKLRKAGNKGILNTQLVKIAIGYRTRISELYKMGYKIDCDYVTTSVCRYTLREEPEFEKGILYENAQDLTMKMIEEAGGRISRKKLEKYLSENGFKIVRKNGSYK